MKLPPDKTRVIIIGRAGPVPSVFHPHDTPQRAHEHLGDLTLDRHAAGDVKPSTGCFGEGLSNRCTLAELERDLNKRAIQGRSLVRSCASCAGNPQVRGSGGWNAWARSGRNSANSWRGAGRTRRHRCCAAPHTCKFAGPAPASHLARRDGPFIFSPRHEARGLPLSRKAVRFGRADGARRERPRNDAPST